MSTYSCSNSTAAWRNVIVATVYTTVLVMGFTLNLMALVFFHKVQKCRSHTTVYMTNLALADLALVLMLPVMVCHHLGFRELPDWLCDCCSLILLVNMYSSIFLLACMCFDRCMAVSFPMSARVRAGRKKAPLVCLGVWTLTIGASLPTYLSKRLKISPEPQEQHCFTSVPLYTTQPVALVATLTLGFGIPLVVMLICSMKLVHVILQSTVAQTDLVDRRKIQKMVGASLLIFLFSFSPYHATLVVLYLNRGAESCSLLAAYQYSLMVACLNSVLDPIVYYFTTETFRSSIGFKAIRKMFPLSSRSSVEVSIKCQGPVNP